MHGSKEWTVLRISSGCSGSATGVPTRVNGLPGFVLHDGDTVETLALEIREGRIVALYSVRNPDKLKHLS